MLGSFDGLPDVAEPALLLFLFGRAGDGVFLGTEEVALHEKAFPLDGR